MKKRMKSAPAGGETGRDVLIEDFLSEVQQGLAVAQGQLESGSFPPLASVTLDLQVEVSREASGGIKILIFTFGKKWEQTRAQEMTLRLRPPPAAPRAAMIAPSGIAEELVRAIVSAAEGVKRASERQPPLVLEKFEAQFVFVVKTDASGGAGLKFQIVPVSADLKGDLSNSARQVVTVTFGR